MSRARPTCAWRGCRVAVRRHPRREDSERPLTVPKAARARERGLLSDQDHAVVCLKHRKEIDGLLRPPSAPVPELAALFLAVTSAASSASSRLRLAFGEPLMATALLPPLPTAATAAVQPPAAILGGAQAAPQQAPPSAAPGAVFLSPADIFRIAQQVVAIQQQLQGGAQLPGPAAPQPALTPALPAPVGIPVPPLGLPGNAGPPPLLSPALPPSAPASHLAALPPMPQGAAPKPLVNAAAGQPMVSGQLAHRPAALQVNSVASSASAARASRNEARQPLTTVVNVQRPVAPSRRVRPVWSDNFDPILPSRKRVSTER